MIGSVKNHNLLAFLLRIIDNAKPSIAAGILIINNKIGLGLAKKGRKNTDPNQPAERFISHSDKVNNMSLDNCLFEFFIVNLESKQEGRAGKY